MANQMFTDKSVAPDLLLVFEKKKLRQGFSVQPGSVEQSGLRICLTLPTEYWCLAATDLLGNAHDLLAKMVEGHAVCPILIIVALRCIQEKTCHKAGE